MTKYRKVLFFLGGLVLPAIAFFFLINSTTKGSNGNAQFHQEMRNALVEVNLPSSNNLTTINAVPDNLATFIFNRSGIQMSQTNKDLLRQTEQQAWNQSKRITKSELSEVLTNVAFERLPNITDNNVDSMADTLHGFDAPSLPLSLKPNKDSVMLRWSGEGRMPTDSFKNQIKNTRNNLIACQTRCSSSVEWQNNIARTAFNNRVSLEIFNILDSLEKADSNFSGGNTNDLTPSEAVLVAYSVISGDILVGNQSDLQNKMNAVQRTRSQLLSQPYPSPQGHYAFGENGYLFSSPVNFLFDDSSMNRIITLIKDKSKMQ